MSNSEKKSEAENINKSPTQQKGEKRNAAELEDKIHSANDWEHADLGDQDRKNKFLRLMGANKKQHQGTFVIGDGSSATHHARSENENQEITDKLEHQFQTGMEHKLTGAARRHTGLGFQNEPLEQPKPLTEPDEKKPVSDCSKDSKDRQSETAQSDNSKTDDKKEDLKKKPFMKMSFVKASS